mgnify:CR=1 FL=1
MASAMAEANKAEKTRLKAEAATLIKRLAAGSLEPRPAVTFDLNQPFGFLGGEPEWANECGRVVDDSQKWVRVSWNTRPINFLVLCSKHQKEPITTGCAQCTLYPALPPGGTGFYLRQGTGEGRARAYTEQGVRKGTPTGVEARRPGNWNPVFLWAYFM